MGSIVSLENISFTYTSDNNRVLKTLSMAVEKNSITAILGPNGVGKTTLLHIILGWIKPEEGTILLLDKKLSSYSQRGRGKLLGLVPQNEHISFEYSLLEYVLLGRSPHLAPLQSPGEKDLSIAFSALETVGLEGIAEKSVTHLSGGEKQLLLVARSIAQAPSILLMDEPMSNLDLANKVRLLEVIGKLKSKGMTILFTSHEPGVAISIADFVVLMSPENHIVSGRTDEVVSAESLSRVYGIPVEIFRKDDKKLVLWH